MNTKTAPVLTLILLIFSLVPTHVTGQTTTLPPVTIGGVGQERSNPEDEDGPKIVTATTTVNVPTTTLPTGATSVQITITPEPNYVVQAGLLLSQTTAVENALEANPGLLIIEATNIQFPTTGPNGAVITLTGLIPANLDAVDTNFNPGPFKVATVNLQFTNTTGGVVGTLPVDVKMQAENQLEIQDVDAEINSKERQSIDDGDTIESLKPGDNVDIEVEVENNYAEDTNLEIEDVDLELDCEGNDLDVDDETIDVGDISEDDSQTETIRFEVEEDAEDTTNGCELSVSGDDRNGARHGEKIDFDVEVERKNHDIQIKNAILNPPSLTCDDNAFQITVDVINLGKSDEDEVALDISSKTLGIQQRIVSSLELDEDDTAVETISIPVEPRRLKSGTYALQLTSFYDNVKASDTQVIQIENTCELADEPSAEPEVPGQEPEQPETPTSALMLEQNTFKGSRGGIVSLPVQVTNKQQQSAEYTVTLDNVGEFAEPSASKTVFLTPGQTSTVFLNMKVKSDTEDGKYSATVKLAQGNTVIEAQEFLVEVTGGTPQTKKENDKNNKGINLGGNTSRIFWIIGDIILIVIAIFFIRLIFTSGKRKNDKQKKMADFEAEAADKKRR